MIDDIIFQFLYENLNIKILTHYPILFSTYCKMFGRLSARALSTVAFTGASVAVSYFLYP